MCWIAVRDDPSWMVDDLVDEKGETIARTEQFYKSMPTYPMALNSKTGNWERGGPFEDGVKARQWCERVAGLHPTKPGDERSPFYY